MSKRQAGVQLTKDREEEEDWGRDGPPDPAEQATAEVLATRKIAMPKSRKRNGQTSTEESSAPNPFTFGSSSTASQAPKSNPFASLGSQEEPKAAAPSNPFGSLNTTSTSTPVFSFGVPAPKPAATEETKTSQETTTEEKKTNDGTAESSEDPEYERLLKYRSINACFVKAINASIENDAFADLGTICDEYKTHRTKATTTEAAKPTNGTGIYPSFKFDAKDDKPNTPSETTQKSDTASLFSKGPSTPAFTYPHNEGSNSQGALQTTYKGFGPLSQEAPATTVPQFTFGKKSEEAPADTSSNKDDEKSEEKTQASPQKTTETTSKDFSWTPDRGIKFGDSSKQTEAKTEPPVFSFTNPMTSPSTTTKAPPAAEAAKPASFGFNFGGSTSNTGFSFGQSAPAAAAATTETKAPPAFSFNASAPTFTFGQSTTPTFSFSAPNKKEEQDETPAAATQEKGDNASAEADGDAMPEEPRTNDALIAGPGVGEEDEEEVYTVPRAKLFKYNSEAAEGSSPWTDLGIVVIRVLVHKETQKARIIARAEGAGALRLNARMYAHFKYSQEGKSNVKVYDLVSATKTDTYLVKMKEAKVATELTKTLNDHKS